MIFTYAMASIMSSPISDNALHHSICLHMFEFNQMELDILRDLYDFYLRNGVYHIQPHLHTTLSMVWPGFWKPGHTIVAVSQQLDPQTVVFRGQSVKPGEQLVQQTHQLLGCALVGEAGEAAYICEQDADVLVTLDVDLVEHGILGLAGNVCLHLHCNVAGKHRQ